MDPMNTSYNSQHAFTKEQYNDKSTYISGGNSCFQGKHSGGMNEAGTSHNNMLHKKVHTCFGRLF